MFFFPWDVIIEGVSLWHEYIVGKKVMGYSTARGWEASRYDRQRVSLNSELLASLRLSC